MSEEAKEPAPEELSLSEKILKVQDLWDEIAESVQPTRAQIEEAERRIAEHLQNPGRKYSTWEELRERLEREL